MTTEEYVKQINNNPVIKMIRDAYKDVRCEQKVKEANVAERRKDHAIMTYWRDFANLTEKFLRNPLMNELQKMQRISTELLRTQGLVNEAQEEFYDELWNIWRDELDIDEELKTPEYSVGDEIDEEFLYGVDESDIEEE